MLINIIQIIAGLDEKGKWRYNCTYENFYRVNRNILAFVLDILDGFGGIHGSQKAVYVDPLAKLAHFGPVQLIAELVLPKK